MKGIYDIHCHIVPGVDDGAKSLKMSVSMLQKEYDDGVRGIIATPHFRYDMFEPSPELVRKQFLRLQKAAGEIGEELRGRDQKSTAYSEGISVMEFYLSALTLHLQWSILFIFCLLAPEGMNAIVFGGEKGEKLKITLLLQTELVN